MVPALRRGKSRQNPSTKPSWVSRRGRPVRGPLWRFWLLGSGSWCCGACRVASSCSAARRRARLKELGIGYLAIWGLRLHMARISYGPGLGNHRHCYLLYVALGRVLATDLLSPASRIPNRSIRASATLPLSSSSQLGQLGQFWIVAWTVPAHGHGAPDSWTVLWVSFSNTRVYRKECGTTVQLSAIAS